MIKLALKTHIINHCIDLIFDNIHNEFSVPQAAKLVVVYLSYRIYLVITPQNKENGYFLSLSAQDILYMDEYSNIKSSHNKLHKVPTQTLKNQLSQINNLVLERDIEYKHSPNNFINVVTEYKEEIGNILIQEYRDELKMN